MLNLKAKSTITNARVSHDATTSVLPEPKPFNDISLWCELRGAKTFKVKGRNPSMNSSPANCISGFVPGITPVTRDMKKLCGAVETAVNPLLQGPRATMQVGVVLAKPSSLGSSSSSKAIKGENYWDVALTIGPCAPFKHLKTPKCSKVQGNMLG